MTEMWGIWLTWLLAAFFVANGVVNFFNPPAFRESYARWGFPSWFHAANGAVQVGLGVLLLFQATRPLGFALAVAVCLAVYGTLIRHREFGHLGPITVVSFLVMLAIARLYA